LNEGEEGDVNAAMGEAKSGTRSGAKSEASAGRSVIYSTMWYEVVASLLPSFTPRPISPVPMVINVGWRGRKGGGGRLGEEEGRSAARRPLASLWPVHPTPHPNTPTHRF